MELLWLQRKAVLLVKCLDYMSYCISYRPVSHMNLHVDPTNLAELHVGPTDLDELHVDPTNFIAKHSKIYYNINANRA